MWSSGPEGGEVSEKQVVTNGRAKFSEWEALGTRRPQNSWGGADSIQHREGSSQNVLLKPSQAEHDGKSILA